MTGRQIERALRRSISHPMERLLLGHRPQLLCQHELHGTQDRYAICPDGISAESVVFSFGVGDNLSFELSLIEKYGLRVFAFDPTPQSLAWARKQSLPAQLQLLDYGIADYDGTARFFPSEYSDRISHTLLERSATADRAIEVPVYRLCTIIEQLGCKRIDIVKMDIEGAEYSVIEDVLRSRIVIPQILVEFHHRFKGVGRTRTKQIVDRLNKSGYRVFYISENNREYSFLLSEGLS